MKIVLTTAALLLALLNTTPLLAQTVTTRDNMGRELFTTSRSGDGTAIVRDRLGREILTTTRTNR